MEKDVSSGTHHESAALPRSRSRILALCVAFAFLILGAQLVVLALEGASSTPFRISLLSSGQSTTVTRPDIVDRNGRLLATDVQVPSLYADGQLIQDPDEATEKLAAIFGDLDQGELRRGLSDRSRRFIWIKRGLSPAVAQSVHNLGIPGVAFVDEVRRTYPAGRLAGHTLGHVDIDNRATGGIERHIDETGSVDPAHDARLSARAPVRLSLDIGVMHAVEDELQHAMRRYKATGAAGLVMDADNGEIVAAVSLPGVDPSVATEGLDPQRTDKILAGTYELGSIFKLLTVAMALEDGANLNTIVDTTAPLTAGRFTISDLHPAGRPLTLAEVFVRSSNVGAGQLSLAAGAQRLQSFFERLGLTGPLASEARPGPRPLLPATIGRAEQITLSYGHGIAVSPLQFMAAAASLLNGGTKITPTFLAARPVPDDASSVSTARIVSVETSAKLNELMRLNVTDPAGTGRRADVSGYDVGGKTGTAEIARKGRYQKKAVIASFLGAFPMPRPRYLTLVMLHEPQGTPETSGEITAGRNAAPTTAAIIQRIAPLLNVAARTPAS